MCGYSRGVRSRISRGYPLGHDTYHTFKGTQEGCTGVFWESAPVGLKETCGPEGFGAVAVPVGPRGPFPPRRPSVPEERPRPRLPTPPTFQVVSAVLRARDLALPQRGHRGDPRPRTTWGLGRHPLSTGPGTSSPPRSGPRVSPSPWTRPDPTLQLRGTTLRHRSRLFPLHFR